MRRYVDTDPDAWPWQDRAREHDDAWGQQKWAKALTTYSSSLLESPLTVNDSFPYTEHSETGLSAGAAFH